MDKQKLGDHRTRQRLAIGIVVTGLVGVTTLGTVSIVKDGDQAKDVLGQVLPLFGTWVGAVIAYYFAKDSLETAARTTKELMTLDHRLKSVKVMDAMIPIGGIEPLKTVPKAKDLDAMTVAEVLDEMSRNRMPVVDSKGVIVLVIHKSTLTEFLTARALEGGDASKLSFTDFKKEKPKLYAKLEAFAFVSSSETLSEAKRAMEGKSKDCADVFVTASGKATEPVMGWITNVEIGKLSQA